MRVRRGQHSEADVAGAVLAWLVDAGWDCYPEVQFSGSSRRADIAATRNGVLWIVECKVSPTLALLEQASWWLWQAQLVSIATPRGYGGLVQRHYCSSVGIGALEATQEYRLDFRERLRVGDHSDDMVWAVQERLRPRWQKERCVNREARGLIAQLHPDMKNYRPGVTADQGFSTPWRRTMQAVERYLGEHPGCTIKELVAGVDHHYSTPVSARGSLLKWIVEKKLARVDESVRPFRLYSLTTASEPSQ